MNVRIILTQEQIALFTIRSQRINAMQEELKKIQESFNRLNNDLNIELKTQGMVWKSIYQNWQIEKPEERLSLVFPDNLEVKLENGSIVCEIPEPDSESASQRDPVPSTSC